MSQFKEPSVCLWQVHLIFFLDPVSVTGPFTHKNNIALVSLWLEEVAEELEEKGEY